MFTETAAFYDAVYSFKDYAREAEELHEVIQARYPARTLLDVACGTGKHLEQFRRSYEVEGVDLDPNLLAIAAERVPGVALHEADMRDFDLGRRFGVVTCLFSSIGYARSVEGLRSAAAAMGRHVEPGGLLIVEPWLTPEGFLPGHLGYLFVDGPELKIARMNSSERKGDLSSMTFEYLIGSGKGIERRAEVHELGLFTIDQHLEAFRAAGLSPEHQDGGPMGRGLYICRRN